MSQPAPTSVSVQDEMVPLDKGKNEVELSPELKELEKRLNTAMLININKCIAEALQPIRDSIDEIVNSSSLVDQQETEIKWLSKENCSLKSQICELKEDIDTINQKLNSLENKSLECNLIFCGIEETFNETDDSLRDVIYHHIADIFNYEDSHDRLGSNKIMCNMSMS